MANKFGRNYKLTVQARNGNLITVQPPFTLEIDIIRNDLSSANTASFRVYNLGQENRNQIRKDRQNFWDITRTIVLQAGYGTNLTTIFSGYMNQAWSVREGTNFITQIEGFDGGQAYIKAETSMEFPAKTTLKNVITALAGSLPGTTIGSIGDFPGVLMRGNSYSGNTITILNQLTNGRTFIDNGKVYCLGDNEVINQVTVPVINSETGLLGTPTLEEQNINLDMIFEPKFSMAQQVYLDSSTAPSFNGTYKIYAIHHKATISEAVCGDAITSLGITASNNLITVSS